MQTGFFHHVGTFLLFAATIFLLITDISAPVVHDIAILKVDLGDSNVGDHVTFGSFGFCIINNGVQNPDACSQSHVGYSPAGVMFLTEGTDFGDYTTKITDGMTKAMVLHPIATVMCFLAFFTSLGAGVVGSLFASFMAALAFIVSLVALIIDFVLFSLVKNKINDQSTDGTKAYFSAAIWTILVSAICSLLGSIIVFLTCCSGRLHRQRGKA